jgi:hypothetical protein
MSCSENFMARVWIESADEDATHIDVFPFGSLAMLAQPKPSRLRRIAAPIVGAAVALVTIVVIQLASGGESMTAHARVEVSAAPANDEQSMAADGAETEPSAVAESAAEESPAADGAATDDTSAADDTSATAESAAAGDGAESATDAEAAESARVTTRSASAEPAPRKVVKRKHRVVKKPRVKGRRPVRVDASTALGVLRVK